MPKRFNIPLFNIWYLHIFIIYYILSYIRFPVIQVRNHVAELPCKKLNMYKYKDERFGRFEKVNDHTPAPGLSKQLINVLYTQCPMFLVYLQVPGIHKDLQDILPWSPLQIKARNMLLACWQKTNLSWSKDTALINTNAKNDTFCSNYWSMINNSAFSRDRVWGRHCKAGLYTWSINLYDHQTTFTKTFYVFLPWEQHSAIHYRLPVGCVHHPFFLPGTRRFQQNRCAIQIILCEPMSPRSMFHPWCSPRMCAEYWLLRRVARPRDFKMPKMIKMCHVEHMYI